MSCKNCISTKNETPRGCNNNGACTTSSCNTFTVFDWLNDIAPPDNESVFPFCEVSFKNGRKSYFKTNSIKLSAGDIIAAQSEKGYDVGVITLLGELVRIQMKKKNINHESNDIFSIYRIASKKDIEQWQIFRNKEEDIKVRAKKLAQRLELKMKISDVEYQGDGNKIAFYYTADDRVDFRELIKLFAREFKSRIEMKQVGLREEASRLGGIGSCGRELCCSTWLNDFRAVNTSSARYQQLSINPSKLSGQCGKLKCCLNYELEIYLEALKDIPKKEIKLKTKKGIAFFQKVDIFKKRIWYSYIDHPMDWYELDANKANEIIQINKQGESVSSIEDFAIITNKTNENNLSLKSNSITRFDKPKRTKYNKSHK
ncbi:MAG TPA: regulatory iron-sulfur-containing complex subunit RicT [Flavobacteriaceae bacterium]|nr:regulatory iron-sulfur-containing complex subunit RicT [Flavobacteriaceae bacterium]